MDPMSIAAVGGLALAGTGQVMSALNQPSGPAQIDPQIAAELQARGVDINQFMAEAQKQGQSFTQLLQQYGLNDLAALQDQYDKSFGGIEAGARDFAQSAFAGKDAPYLTNQIAAYGANVGSQREGTDASVEQMIANSGIDPSSLYAAELRRKAQEGITGQFNSGVASMRNQSALTNLSMANDIMKTGMTSNRLAGTQLPETPQTADQIYKKTYDEVYNSKIGMLGDLSKLPPVIKTIWMDAAAKAAQEAASKASNGFVPGGVQAPTGSRPVYGWEQAGGSSGSGSGSSALGYNSTRSYSGSGGYTNSAIARAPSPSSAMTFNTPNPNYHPSQVGPARPPSTPTVSSLAGRPTGYANGQPYYSLGSYKVDSNGKMVVV